MGWIGGLAQRATGGKSSGSVLSWGKRRIEDALAKAIGARLIGDIAQIFADLSIVRVRFSQGAAGRADPVR